MPAGLVPAVQFEHVSLAFDDAVVLRDLSFSVPAGKMTIIIGASDFTRGSNAFLESTDMRVRKSCLLVVARAGDRLQFTELDARLQ